MNAQIKKLAEAIFQGHLSINGKLREDFDPFTDANDCDALIKYLNEDNVEVNISHQVLAARVTLRWFNTHGEQVSVSRKCNNWKQGVCELALKVVA